MLQSRWEPWNATEIISKHITRFMDPFKPGAVTVKIARDKEDLRNIVLVTINSLPNDTVVLRDFETWYRADMGYLATEIGIRAGKILSKTQIPVEPNIELGEN